MDDPRTRYLCNYVNELEANTEKIAFVQAHLADQRSRDTYLMVAMGSPVALCRHYVENVFDSVQYFRYVTTRPGDVIINGGVHTGTEVPFFLSAMQGRGLLMNVDPLGHDYLSGDAEAAAAAYRANVHEERLAFADEDGVASFPVADEQVLGRARNRQIEGAEYRTFPCMTLDSFVVARGLERLDLIKLDLEGAEQFVLPTMMETVRRFRPQLAISIYHANNHFWDLPLFLMKQCSGYRFFFDHHSFERYEAILYAIPEERPIGPPFKS